MSEKLYCTPNPIMNFLVLGPAKILLQLDRHFQDQARDQGFILPLFPIKYTTRYYLFCFKSLPEGKIL